jgi:hypothetical protein
MEASTAMKVIAAEVAAHLGMSRKAATKSKATTGEMASTKPAAHVSATAEPAAHVSGTAEPAAHMTAAAEPAPMSTSSAAARKRVSGQCPVESGSRQQ